MNESQVIICKPIKAIDDLLLDQVEKTYNSSFPEEERRAFSLVRSLLVDNDHFMMYALLRDDVYVGFITAWCLGVFTYIEHFAIDEAARNGGIGAKAMNSFFSIHKQPVVLEVEMPAEEMSKRRVGFYERLGFVLDHHKYHQPPYRQGEDWIEMRLMTHGRIDLADTFDQVESLIHKHVYGVK